MVITFKVSWKGKPVIFEDEKDWVSPTEAGFLCMESEGTISDLKDQLFKATRVRPEHQKLLGLVVGKIPSDDSIKLADLNLMPAKKIMLMGCADETVLSFINSEEAKGLSSTVIDDFEWDYEPAINIDEANLAFKDDNLKALEKMKAKMKSIPLMAEPRVGKKLLVMDLDYTLFDCKAENVAPMAALRRGTHEFLEAMYEHFDIAVWSQTSRRVLTMKLEALGMMNHPNYKLTFILDRTVMFKISTVDPKKQIFKHEVKALELIWDKLGHLYDCENTVHVDDLARNFAMNPNHGIKVKGFHLDRNPMDDELLHLAQYLTKIASKSKIDPKIGHRNWKK